jgi:1,4-alpha-glucan branching enzyme
MKMKPCFSIIINCHHPFVSFLENEQVSEGEQSFFEALSETYLPLLELFSTLENKNIHFRLALVISPSLCFLFRNKKLMDKYLFWLDKRIEFGRQELDRCKEDEELFSLASFYFDRDLERRISLTERYNMDILGAFEDFQKKGRLEFLLTAATNAFLPFYASMKEAVNAQIESALIHHRRYLGKPPAGFWLPELGWTSALGSRLREYGVSYTVVDAHALVLGNPPATAASFCPVKTPSGLIVFARDISAQKDLEGLVQSQSGIYQARYLDAGFELSASALQMFQVSGGCRCSTGYRYWMENDKERLYKPQKAREAASTQAGAFLDLRVSRLEKVQACLDNINAISIWAFDADTLGRSWFEGTVFLEKLFSEIEKRGDILLQTPQDYLDRTSNSSFQLMEPEFSSSLHDGYGGILLDASNDWIYRHIFRSIHRMVEMTGRFPNDTGLKERALNQAAREILLAQSTDWSKPLNPLWKGKMNRDYAKKELEGALRNFTTIYEALGSNHISTDWLTGLERRHSLLPYINYRVFGTKK